MKDTISSHHKVITVRSERLFGFEIWKVIQRNLVRLGWRERFGFLIPGKWPETRKGYTLEDWHGTWKWWFGSDDFFFLFRKGWFWGEPAVHFQGCGRGVVVSHITHSYWHDLFFFLGGGGVGCFSTLCKSKLLHVNFGNGKASNHLEGTSPP